MLIHLMVLGGVSLLKIIDDENLNEEGKNMSREYWKEIKSIDKKLYNKFRYRSATILAFILPTYTLKSFASRKIYGAYQKKLKLG